MAEVDVKSEAVKECKGTGKRGANYSVGETKELVKLALQSHNAKILDDIKGKRELKVIVWESFAEVLNKKFGKKRDSASVENKLCSLKATYMKARDKKTSEAFEYFDEYEAHYGRKEVVEPSHLQATIQADGTQPPPVPVPTIAELESRSAEHEPSAPAEGKSEVETPADDEEAPPQRDRPKLAGQHPAVRKDSERAATSRPRKRANVQKLTTAVESLKTEMQDAEKLAEEHALQRHRELQEQRERHHQEELQQRAEMLRLFAKLAEK